VHDRVDRVDLAQQAGGVPADGVEVTDVADLAD
jgi:hypothetical protein